MEHFKNLAEKFYREIRSIEIYPASAVSYIDNYNAVFPTIDKALYVFEIVPESYTRKLPTKTQNKNYFFDVDINFSVLDLSKETTKKCYEYFNKRGFAIVLNSNTERMMLGNDREDLTIDFLDGKKDDNSGNDENTISITVETIIPPKTQNL